MDGPVQWAAGTDADGPQYRYVAFCAWGTANQARAAWVFCVSVRFTHSPACVCIQLQQHLSPGPPAVGTGRAHRHPPVLWPLPQDGGLDQVYQLPDHMVVPGALPQPGRFAPASGDLAVNRPVPTSVQLAPGSRWMPQGATVCGATRGGGGAGERAGGAGRLGPPGWGGTGDAQSVPPTEGAGGRVIRICWRAVWTVRL